ncbi:hypothetical protein [Priestia megaterium]|uniref:hypothetical protein n=1 Tax=Priestia megaterium TaxID=1404 RepID=UPI000BFC50E1|nr:hypothetical protein [Priestia megaterium]PGQ88257.1 hypothetical protein COA18_04840 [Priestia megaterium]
MLATKDSMFEFISVLNECGCEVERFLFSYNGWHHFLVYKPMWGKCEVRIKRRFLKLGYSIQRTTRWNRYKI